MQPLLVIAYLGIGLVQFAATMGGLADWSGLHWIIVAPVALFLSYLPLVGSAIGALGAVQAWGWSWVWASLLFCWPVVILGVVALGFVRRAAEGMDSARMWPPVAHRTRRSRSSTRACPRRVASAPASA